MADYWKSTEKKYCEFCKCWIGHDKMTISLHENGRKHKENVTKKISAMHKKSSQDYKASVKMDKEIRKMEEAGLKAYMNDIESNADLTSKNINETMAKTNSKLVLGSIGSSSGNVEPEEKKSLKKSFNKKNKKSSSTKKDNSASKTKSADVSLWYEAKAADGNIYYWHIQTKESVWEPPSEGFMSIEEQESLLEKQKKDLEELEESKKLIEKEIIEEQRAQNERERYKRIKLETAEPESTYRYGPTNRIDPYGKWSTVSSTSKKSIDLQLPVNERASEIIPIYIPATKPEKVFKEKLVTYNNDDSDDDYSDKNISFKKRKIGAAGRRNVRQRTDDD